MTFELTAEQHGYYLVFVDGHQFSKHVQEREAIQQAINAKQEVPAVPVHYSHPYRVVVELTDEVLELPGPSEPPTSDAGEDLIDFLARVHGEPVEVNFLEAPDFRTALKMFATETKGTWLVKRLFAEANGEHTWIGVGWRGYVLLFIWRDRFIRVHTGGGS